MQTFLPYSNFKKSAQALDRLRLGKQRVECLQILDTLLNNKKAWSNHPAVKMWRGKEVTLFVYATCICNEWTRRGYKDTCLNKMANLILIHLQKFGFSNHDHPAEFLGNRKFHLSHKSNLIRKFPEHYRLIFGLDIPDNLEYIWSVK